MRVYGKDGEIVEYIAYLTLNDEQLERVRKDSKYGYDIDFLREIHYTEGDNMLILTIRCNEGYEFIMKEMNNFLKQYKSVSWWGRGDRRFFTRRRHV